MAKVKKIRITGTIGIIPEEKAEKYIQGEKQWLISVFGFTERAAERMARAKIISHNRIELLVRNLAESRKNKNSASK